MNKTVTINISGIIFHIEEDAYSKLQNYMQRLRDQFNKEEGRDEIMADIEARIAELLKAKTGISKEVVVMADIDHVIEIMGRPEVFSETDDQGSANNDAKTGKQSNTSGQSNQRRRTYRRLFRDPDDKVISGVCSGLGHYFDLNPVWIRLGFAGAFFFLGTGVLLYFILLIIMPKAHTTVEKLEMRGEPVDVNNIRRSIREEIESFGRRVEDLGNEATEWSKKQFGSSSYQNYRERDRKSGLEQFFTFIFNLMGKFFALALVIIGVLLLIALTTSTFSLSHIGPEVLNRNLKNLFADDTNYILAIVALLLVFGIPCLMMMYKGICLLLRIRRKDNTVGITALSFWVIGIILTIYVAVSTAQNFTEEGRVTERYSNNLTSSDTLLIQVDIDPDMKNRGYKSKWNRRYHYKRRIQAFSLNGRETKFGQIQLKIVETRNDSFELMIYRSARGSNIYEATTNARLIRYQLRQEGNRLILPSYFTIGGDQRWRDQEIEMELRVPRDKVIYLDPTTEEFIYDVENIQNVWDNDMVDRRWKMTANGLTCLDCAGIIRADEVGKDVIKTDNNASDAEKILNEKINQMVDSMRRAARK
jgi:phage shock protein PspC (stress-responsive transcriptional regulator)